MRLRYDKRAASDIAEIHSFIAKQDEAAASRVIARIRALSEQLRERPNLGRATNNPRIRVRAVVDYPFLIFYTHRDDEIVILHVRHTARRAPDPTEV